MGRTWGSRPPTLKIHDTTMFEADGLAALRVTLDPPSSGRVTVNYATSGLTATPGADYTETSGTLTLEPGITNTAVWVSVIHDNIDDSGKQFRVTLSNPTGRDSVNGAAVIGDATAVATILNRDRHTDAGTTDTEDGSTPGQPEPAPEPKTPAPVSYLSVADASASEEDDTALLFTVTLDPASEGIVSVAYATANGTATAGGDYTATSGTHLQRRGNVQDHLRPGPGRRLRRRQRGALPHAQLPRRGRAQGRRGQGADHQRRARLTHGTVLLRPGLP